MKALSDLQPVDLDKETSKKKKKGVVSDLKPVEDAAPPKLPMPIPDTLSMMQKYPSALRNMLINAPLIPKTRPSDPVKQFVGGVSDWGTGAASLAGMVGSGIEALANTPEAQFDPETKTWLVPEEIGHPGLRRPKTFGER